MEDLAVDPSGRTVAVATSVTSGPYGVYLVSLEDGKVASTVRGVEWTDKGASSVAFSPDGKTLLIAGAQLRLLALPAFTPVRAPADADHHLNDIEKAAISADGKYLVTCQQFGVRVWDLGVDKIIYDGHPDLVKNSAVGRFSGSCKFSANGEWIAASTDLTYYECHWRTGPCSSRAGDVRDFAFRPDNKAVAMTTYTKSGDRDKLLIQMLSGDRVVRSVPGGAWADFSHLVFSPDGKKLALGGDGLGIMNAEKGPVQKLFYSKEYPVIEHLAFTPDGKRIVFVMRRAEDERDNRLGLWDLAGNKIVWEVEVPALPGQ